VTEPEQSPSSIVSEAVDKGGQAAGRDRLTILRLLLLTAGVAVGVTVWGPSAGNFDPLDTEHWRHLWNAVLLGLSLPAPLFTVRFGRRGPRHIGAGGLFALTVALGAFLMMPPMIAARLGSMRQSGAVICSFYVFPLMALWYALAALLGGHLTRKLFGKETPWSERYGFLLALLWSPLGVWALADLYTEVL
jgi:hypothetical protein